MHNVSDAEFALRLLLALGLGSGIGFERQLHHHEAGLKINALVAAGSAMFVMMASFFTEPDRIVAQIMPGIGFLGAGMIMRDGLHVRGLNTAATLWCAASIGTLAGSGHPAVASIGAAVIVSANIVLTARARVSNTPPKSETDHAPASPDPQGCRNRPQAAPVHRRAADLHTIFAKVGGEKFTAFLVERAYTGLQSGAEEKKMGLKGRSTTAVYLDNVKVPVENVLGEVGHR